MNRKLRDNWIDEAFTEARKGIELNEGGPFGAVVVRNGKVISRAHNEVLKTMDPTAHAEIIAIRRASEILQTYDLSSCILYTTCYPCPMCMGAIFWARIPIVYYASSAQDAAEGGFDDQIFYEKISHPQNALDLRPVDPHKGKELFALWAAKEDKKRY